LEDGCVGQSIAGSTYPDMVGQGLADILAKPGRYVEC
jgi:hypothetical protein